MLDLTISVSNRKLRAATHGNGVYQINLLEQPIHTNSQEIDVLIDNIQIFPNPSRGVFNIAFTSKTVQDVRLKVLNTAGKVMIVEDLEQFVGNYTKPINLKENAKGIYFLEIETDDEKKKKKLILQ